VIVLSVPGIASSFIDTYFLNLEPTNISWQSLFEISASNLVYWITLWPFAALTIKRFHDLGMTGWWTIVMLPTVLLWPVFVMFSELAAYGELISSDIGALKYVGTIWLMAIFILNLMQLGMRGNVGVNRFGPDPLERN